MSVGSSVLKILISADGNNSPCVSRLIHDRFTPDKHRSIPNLGGDWDLGGGSGVEWQVFLPGEPGTKQVPSTFASTKPVPSTFYMFQISSKYQVLLPIPSKYQVLLPIPSKYQVLLQVPSKYQVLLQVEQVFCDYLSF